MLARACALRALAEEEARRCARAEMYANVAVIIVFLVGLSFAPWVKAAAAAGITYLVSGPVFSWWIVKRWQRSVRADAAALQKSA